MRWACCFLTILLLSVLPGSSKADLFYRVEKVIRLTDSGLNPAADGTIPMSVTGLNDAGAFVGYFPSATANKLHAFLWDNPHQTFIDLNNLLAADSSLATCLNDSGTVAGYFWELGTYALKGFIYHPDGTVSTFTAPDGAGGAITAVTAINASGDLVGTYTAADSSTRGFIVQQGGGGSATITDLGDLGQLGFGQYIWPNALNDADQVVGNEYLLSQGGGIRHNYTEGFFWDGAMSLIDASDLSDNWTAVALNNNGQAVGLYGLGGTPGAPFAVAGSYYWDPGTGDMDLGDLGGGAGANVFALTDYDYAVGTSLGGDGTLHLFTATTGNAVSDQIVDVGSVSLYDGDTSFLPLSLNSTVVRNKPGTMATAVYNIAGFGTDADGNTLSLLWMNGGIHRVVDLMPAYLSFATVSYAYGSLVLINDSQQIACAGTDSNGHQMALLLSVDPDTDNDGLPDSWEMQYYGRLGVGKNDLEAGGGGLTNEEAYQQGFDPTDFYQGQTPTLVAISGTPQTGSPGGLVPLPLVVQVTNSTDAPAANVAVTFSTDAGQFQASSSALPVNTLTVQADANGLAHVFFVLPNTSLTTCTATATVTNNKTGLSGQTTFTLSSDDGTGTFASPFALALQSTFNEDASTTLSWSILLDGVTGFAVSRSDDGGNTWTLLATLPATNTTYTVAAAQQGIVGYSLFKVQAQVASGQAASGTSAATPSQPPARYAVIDLGLTQQVGYPEQINNNATVMLVNPNGTISRWRQGNVQPLGTVPIVDVLPTPWFIVDLENPWEAILDNMDNVILNTGYYGRTTAGAKGYSASGASFDLAPDPASQASGSPGSAWVFAGDNGTFYGASSWKATDPASGQPYGYMDGAQWSGANAVPVECGSAQGFQFPYSSANSVLVSNHVSPGSDFSDEINYYWGTAQMMLQGQEYYPYLQNSRGDLLIHPYYSDNPLGFPLYLAGNTGGGFGFLTNMPDMAFLDADVWGFNAVMITVPGAQSQVYAPQLVGVDTLSGTPFLYEENPASQQYVEENLNSMIASNGGWTITSATGINDSGAISGVATYQPQSEADPTPAGEHAIILVSLDISLTFGYHANVGRSPIEIAMRQIPGLRASPVVQGDLHIFFYNGVDSTGKSKTWVVQTSTNQDSLANALKGTPYVYYGGHANDGAGFALKSHSADNDFDPKNIKSLSDFMSLRNAQFAVPWRQFNSDEYPNFGDKAISASQIVDRPTNYALQTPYNPPLKDGSGAPNNERYPNNASSSGKHVAAGEIFPSPTGSGIDKHHMTRVVPNNSDSGAGNYDFLVVKVDDPPKPTFGYKIFCAFICNGMRDYGEAFGHGCFISTTDYSALDNDAPSAFVRALVQGGGAPEIISRFNLGGNNDITQANH